MVRWRMPAWGRLAFLALAAGSCSAPPAVAVAPATAGELLVRFLDGTPIREREACLAAIGARSAHPLGQSIVWCVTLPAATTAAGAARLAADPRVAFVEPNRVWSVDAAPATGAASPALLATVPDDPLFPQQWALRNTGQSGGTPGADVDATLAWDLETGSRDIVVAVLDTGLDFAHPDLAANAYANPGEVPGNGIDDDGNGFVDDVRGWDFVNDDADPSDDQGHGTLISGPCAAAGHNGLGIAGLSWQVSILPVKCLTSTGTGTTADIVLSMFYAIDMGARVLLAGWGGGAYSQALHDAIQAAGDAGIPFVCAAGASGTNLDLYPVYPASYALSNVVAVAATDAADNLASFSNWGPGTVDLGSPGVGIVTTLRGGSTGVVSGTAAAAAHVAGAFALLFARFPSFAGDPAIDHLLARVDAVPSLAGKVRTGGRLNAHLPLADAPTEAVWDPASGGRAAGGRPPGRCLWWQPSRTEPGRIGFELPHTGDVRLDVFDVHGRRVRTFRVGTMPAGRHTLAWDGRDDAARPAGRGVYLVRLRSSGTEAVVRVPAVR